MIVPTMSIEEIVLKLEGEEEQAQWKILDAVRKLESRVLKTRRFPAVFESQVITREKTTINLCLRANKHSDWKNAHVTLYTKFHLQNGLNVIALASKRGGDVVFYTKHFLERYRERVLKDMEMPPAKMVSELIRRNYDLLWQYSNENFVRKLEKYQEECQGDPIVCVINDGYCFGEMLRGRIIVMRTVITEEMLRERQDEAFAHLRARVDILRERYNRLVKKNLITNTIIQ